MDEQCSEVEIIINTSDYGDEITWLIDDGGKCFGSNHYEDYTEYKETCCLGKNIYFFSSSKEI